MKSLAWTVRWIYRVGQVDNEVRWLGKDYATAAGVGSGYGKTNQLPIGESVLLRCAD